MFKITMDFEMNESHKENAHSFDVYDPLSRKITRLRFDGNML